MFYISIDNKPSFFAITTRPNIPTPEEKVNVETLEGMDGSLYESTGFYEDIEIEVECNYVTPVLNWHNLLRDIRKFIKGSKLQFSDDILHFYKIKKATLGECERVLRKGARFTINFVLAPYSYISTGEHYYPFKQAMNNLYDTCHPVYHITGEGECTLTVNGKEMSADVGQELFIDTDLRIAYRTNLENGNVTGDYTDLWLNHGINEISITSGFNLEVKPNWREL